MKQIAPYVLQSYEMPPFKSKLPINLVWICWKSGCCSLIDKTYAGTHSQGTLGQFAYLDGHRQNHSMLFLQIHEFFSSQLFSMSNMLEKWSQETKIQSSQIGGIYEVSRKYLLLKQCLYQNNFEFHFRTGFGQLEPFWHSKLKSIEKPSSRWLFQTQ